MAIQASISTVLMAILAGSALATNGTDSQDVSGNGRKALLVNIAHPNRQARKTCSKYRLYLLSTKRDLQFDGHVTYLPTQAFCDMERLHTSSNQTVVCALSGRDVHLFEGNTRPIRKSVCKSNMRSYVLEVVRGDGPGTLGTTYVVMKYPRPQEMTGSNGTNGRYFRPDRLPFAATVTIRSARDRRVDAIRKAVKRVSSRGLAWRALFNSHKVFTSVKKVGKRRYIVFFMFDEAFREELPPPS